MNIHHQSHLNSNGSREQLDSQRQGHRRALDYYPAENEDVRIQDGMEVHTITVTVPYLVGLALSHERVVYRPAISMSPRYGSLPVISVQGECGPTAVNFHEREHNTQSCTAHPEEDLGGGTSLVPPPWLMRAPTEEEIQIEKEFEAQDPHWERQYHQAVQSRRHAEMRMRGKKKKPPRPINARPKSPSPVSPIPSPRGTFMMTSSAPVSPLKSSSSSSSAMLSAVASMSTAPFPPTTPSKEIAMEHTAAVASAITPTSSSSMSAAPPTLTKPARKSATIEPFCRTVENVVAAQQTAPPVATDDETADTTTTAQSSSNHKHHHVSTPRPSGKYVDADTDAAVGVVEDDIVRQSRRTATAAAGCVSSTAPLERSDDVRVPSDVLHCSPEQRTLSVVIENQHDLTNKKKANQSVTLPSSLLASDAVETGDNAVTVPKRGKGDIEEEGRFVPRLFSLRDGFTMDWETPARVEVLDVVDDVLSSNNNNCNVDIDEVETTPMPYDDDSQTNHSQNNSNNRFEATDTLTSGQVQIVRTMWDYETLVPVADPSMGFAPARAVHLKGQDLAGGAGAKAVVVEKGHTATASVAKQQRGAQSSSSSAAPVAHRTGRKNNSCCLVM
eukprot:PhM_4_TR2705/c0_g1_i1/m.34118